MNDQDNRPVHMWTSDRVAQCDYLREVAAETYGLYVADPEDRYTGEEVVEAWEKYQNGDLPDWFDDHDRHLLAGYIQGRLDAYWAERDSID